MGIVSLSFRFVCFEPFGFFWFLQFVRCSEFICAGRFLSLTFSFYMASKCLKHWSFRYSNSCDFVLLRVLVVVCWCWCCLKMMLRILPLLYNDKWFELWKNGPWSKHDLTFRTTDPIRNYRNNKKYQACVFKLCMDCAHAYYNIHINIERFSLTLVFFFLQTSNLYFCFSSLIVGISVFLLWKKCSTGSTWFLFSSTHIIRINMRSYSSMGRQFSLSVY